MKEVFSLEERAKIHELCKVQLSGEWADVDENELFIDTVAGGGINKLVICCLPENCKTVYNKVIIRYNNQDMNDFKSNTHVMAIYLIASELGISPKLLSIFAEGTISHFIKARYFNSNDDLDQTSVEKLGKLLAKFHSLELPLPKSCSNMFLVLVDNPFFDQMKKSYNEGAVRQEIEKQQFPTLMEMNFIEELEWVSKILVEANSPVVFSHNDFGRKNILVKESTEGEGSPPEIFLIDFDWTNYNSRGVDFGQYFSSWAQTEPDFGSGDFPSDEEMAPLIDAYIKGMCDIFGTTFAEQEINSRQHIIKEAKIYTLMAFMKDIMYCIWQTDLMNKEFLVKGERRMKCYKNLKNKILKEYSLK